MRARSIPIALLVLIALCHFHCEQTALVSSPSDLSRISKAMRSPSGTTILVAAHRGAHSHAPENSLAAFQAAIAIGADVIETDVRQTRDGELILMHDEEVARTTNGSGRVRDKTLKEIKQLSLSNGQAVPTLAEALDLIAGRIYLDLDIKHAGLDRILSLLQQTQTQQQVLLFGSAAKLDSIVAMDSTWLIMPRAKTTTEMMQLCHHFRPPVLHVDATFLQPADAALLQRQGTHLWLNALLWPDIKAMLGFTSWAYAPLLQSGATIIQTDRPQQLLAYLRENKKHW